MLRDDKKPYRLMVEGSDDQWSLIHLMSRHGLDWDRQTSPFVHAAGSDEELLRSLATAAKNYQRLGIVMDADLNPGRRLEQVRDRLRDLGIEWPGSMERDGLIVTGWRADYRVGLWIMPDNQTPGVLEDFLARLVPENDICWEHARQATVTARTLGAPLPEKDFAKGTLHAWLAWQDPPGRPLSTALKAEILGHDSQASQCFASWFNKLFSE